MYDKEVIMNIVKGEDESKYISKEDLEVFYKMGDVRRPLILIRGKPITEEQVKELITGEEPLFTDPSKIKDNCHLVYDPRYDRGSLKNIFYRSGYDWLSTWVYTDGTIGGNIISWKYPDLDECLNPYAHLAEKYSFLDMVVSYTMYNECTCSWCDAMWIDKPIVNGDLDIGDGDVDADSIYDKVCNDKECKMMHPWLRRYMDKYAINDNFLFNYCSLWELSHVREDVATSVVLTLWIHDGEVHLMFGTEAQRKFELYNSLYCASEYAYLFSNKIFKKGQTCICDKKFVEDCFEYIGLPRATCDDYVKRGFISEFDIFEKVIIKEDIIAGYNKYVKPIIDGDITIEIDKAKYEVGEHRDNIYTDYGKELLLNAIKQFHIDYIWYNGVVALILYSKEDVMSKYGQQAKEWLSDNLDNFRWFCSSYGLIDESILNVLKPLYVAGKLYC